MSCAGIVARLPIHSNEQMQIALAPQPKLVLLGGGISRLTQPDTVNIEYPRATGDCLTGFPTQANRELVHVG